MVQTVQSLKVFNTLSGKKEEFNPIDPSHVKIYACGPTVYNYAHIGNARMAVVFDTLVRLLRYTHPKVTYVSNITDIDDKIIDAANELNLPIKEITEITASVVGYNGKIVWDKSKPDGTIDGVWYTSAEDATTKSGTLAL